MEEKQNCWDFEKCERGPLGAKAEELGVCPAATEKRLNSVHGGVNGGRACWVVPDTVCRGETQGTFAQKYKTCLECDFYKLVSQEEFPNLYSSIVLLKKLD